MLCSTLSHFLDSVFSLSGHPVRLRPREQARNRITKRYQKQIGPGKTWPIAREKPAATVTFKIMPLLLSHAIYLRTKGSALRPSIVFHYVRPRRGIFPDIKLSGPRCWARWCGRQIHNGHIPTCYWNTSAWVLIIRFRGLEFTVDGLKDSRDFDTRDSLINFAAVVPRNTQLLYVFVVIRSRRTKVDP